MWSSWDVGDFNHRPQVIVRHLNSCISDRKVRTTTVCQGSSLSIFIMNKNIP